MPREEEVQVEMVEWLARQEPISRAGCRIVAFADMRLAFRLASRLPSATIIVLDVKSESAERPHNLDVLTCDAVAAQFLPGSVAAVLATGASPLGGADGSELRIVTEWLEPGGKLLLARRAAPRSRWLRLGNLWGNSLGRFRRSPELAERNTGGSFAVFEKCGSPVIL